MKQSNITTGMTRTERPCIGCGRTVAYRASRQYVVNGGKPRVRHNCPHGVPCQFGSFFKGDGCNGPARAGPHYCPECWSAWVIKQHELNAKDA